MSLRKAVFDEMLAWLEQFWWRWIGVLTFRRGIRPKRARSLLLEWISMVERDEGHRISFWAALEFGDESNQLHYHIMIAGITSRLRHYFQAWEEMAGFPKLAPFRSSLVRTTESGLVRSSGIAYALKSFAKDDFDFEAELLDEHLLPRFRKPQGPQEAPRHSGSRFRKLPHER
jgi:hypothetical protein